MWSIVVWVVSLDGGIKKLHFLRASRNRVMELITRKLIIFVAAKLMWIPQAFDPISVKFHWDTLRDSMMYGSWLD